MATFTPTKQQQDVTNFFESTFGPEYAGKLTSIFLNAVAGAGKTSTIMLQIETLMKIEKELGRALVACNLSFNTNIRDASKVKMTAIGSTVEAKTTNQLGRGILAAAAKDGMCAAPHGKADAKKYKVLAEEQLQDWKYNKLYFENFKEYNRAVTAVVELVDAVRATQMEPTEDNLIDIIMHYRLEDKIDVTAPYWSLVATSVGLVLKKGISAYNRGCTVEIDGDKEVYKKGWHDFNDQICLPLYLDLASPTWDVIFIDEAQDLNVARRMMITRSIKPNGTLFFVGDPDQSIQGFTFSDTDSVDNIIEHTGAVQFPLSVCWRCDSDIIRLAQVLVPRIEARPNAPKGIVDVLSSSKFIETLEPGYKRGSEEKDPDLALCRVKKDLVENCLACIRAGKPAIVRGREIGRGITTLLDDVVAKHPAPVAELYRSIQEYADNKVSKLLKKKNSEQAISDFMDNVDTLSALVGGFLEDEKNQYASIDELKTYIAAKFADDDTEQTNADRVKPIVFSTIHKAKGLEYDRVFILSPELLPHPLSKGGWQEKQERNIIYVAITRAKKALYFVGGVPALLADKYQEMKAEEQAALDASAAIAEAEKIVTEAAAPAEAEEQAAIKEKLAAGRKAKLAEDKEKKIEAFFDPSVRACLKDFYNMLLESDQETREEKVPASKNKKLKEADVVEAAVIAFMGEYFTTSDHYQEYLDRQERKEQAREEYKERKNKRRSKKAAAAPAPEVDDQDEGPDDDGGPDNGGGQPAPSTFVDDDYDSDVVMTLFEDNLGIPRSEHIDWHALEAIQKIAASSPDNDQPAPADGPYVFDEIVDIDQDGGTSYGSASLFPDLPAEEPIERPVRRMFFHCLSKRCNSPRWATDYYVINEGKFNEQMYRSDGGKVIYAVNDFVKCPDCGNDGAFIKKSILQGEVSHSRKCDPRCWNATSAKCKCPCGGLRHGLGEPGKEAPIKFIGTPLLKMPL